VEAAKADPTWETPLAQELLQLLGGLAGQGMREPGSERTCKPHRHLGGSRLRIEVRHDIFQRRVSHDAGRGEVCHLPQDRAAATNGLTYGATASFAQVSWRPSR
jgi:hypothetical protein